MNYKKLTIIALKILAINVFIRMTFYLPGIMFGILRSDYEMPDRSMEIISSIIPIILLLILSVLLWVFSDKIARSIVKNDDEEGLISVDYNKVQQVAFSILGVYLISISLPTFASVLFRIYKESSIEMGMRNNISMYYPMLVSEITRLILGILLIFGAKGLSNIINKVRKLD